MKRPDAIKLLVKLTDDAIKARTPINIKLYFNSDGELDVSTHVENPNFLTSIGNAGDSPLEPYLEKFASSFTKLKRKEHGSHT